MDNLTTKKQYEVHYYDVDINKKAHIITITNWFQDLFVYQSHVINVGIDFLLKQNLTWIVSKWDIKILNYPSYNEKVTVTSHPVKLKKFYMYIKFQILNEKGELIVEAMSLWVLIDTVKIAPHKIPQDILDVYNIENEVDDITIGKINQYDCMDSQKIFNVNYSDIDTNGHVNNSRYISWAFDTIPENILKECDLKNISINYKKNTCDAKSLYSGIKKVTRDNEDYVKLSHVISKEDNTTLVIMESTWQKKVV